MFEIRYDIVTRMIFAREVSYPYFAISTAAFQNDYIFIESLNAFVFSESYWALNNA